MESFDKGSDDFIKTENQIKQILFGILSTHF